MRWMKRWRVIARAAAAAASDREVPAMTSAAVATEQQQPRMEEVIETEETLKRFDPPGGQLIARPEASGKAVHKLSTPFSFWYVRRVQGPRTQENYERNIKRIATVDSVSDIYFFLFCSHLSHSIQVEAFWPFTII